MNPPLAFFSINTSHLPYTRSVFLPRLRLRQSTFHPPLAVALPVIQAKTKELVFGNPSVLVEKGKYGYDVETLINKLSSLPPRGSIARCLDVFKKKLSLNDFAHVFKEFSQRGDWQRSLRLFKYMQRQLWCKPNDHIYTLVIGILGREGLLDKCAELFDEMTVHGVPRSALSYTALINAYGRNGDYTSALRLLDQMQDEENIPPTLLTYNTVLNSCARGGVDWEDLLGLFARIRRQGIQPDLLTYNTLLAACASRSLGDEAEMVFRNMNEAGIIPDLTTYTYLVETFNKLGSLIRVSELLRKMVEEGNQPDITSYNVLLEAHARQGSISGAIDVFRQMKSAGCLANAGTYRILLNLYGEQGKFDDVRELFLEMKVSDAEPDAETYNILIKAFGEGGYFKEVVTLFDDMVEEKVDPNMETYEGLIFACGKGGLYADAKRILMHMNDRGLVPSSKAYTGVLEAYGQAGMYEEALVAFNSMNEVGSKPTIETYNSLIHTFARGGLYNECEAILWRMNDVGIARNGDSINGLIEAFQHAGQFEEAMKSFVEMEKANCSPDEQTLEAVLKVYSSAGLLEESIEQFREIQASELAPSVLSYCMLLSVYAKNNRWDDVYELLEEMKTKRISNVHQVIGSMIKGEFDDEFNWQMVEYVFDKLNSEGVGFGMKFYNALLEALWYLGQRARAAKVLDEARKRGLFPELYRWSKLVWSADVHRMSVGGALLAISVWLNEMYSKFTSGDDLPHLATAVVVRGQAENNMSSRVFPVAQATSSFLKDEISSSFVSPAWNKGRIICHRPQLKRLLSNYEHQISKDHFVSIQNIPFPQPGVSQNVEKNEIINPTRDPLKAAI